MPGGGDAGSLLPGVLPPELGASRWRISTETCVINGAWTTTTNNNNNNNNNIHKTQNTQNNTQNRDAHAGGYAREMFLLLRQRCLDSFHPRVLIVRTVAPE